MAILLVFSVIAGLISAGIEAVISKNLAKGLLNKQVFGLSLQRLVRWIKDGRLYLLRFKWFQALYSAKNFIGRYLR